MRGVSPSTSRVQRLPDRAVRASPDLVDSPSYSLLSLDVETRGLPPLAPPPRVCGEVYLTYLTSTPEAAKAAGEAAANAIRMAGMGTHHQ